MVEPEFPLNVGYVARAMANFGLKQLYLISEQRDSLNRTQALQFSSHGQRIVEELKHVRNLDLLRNRFQVLVGTTAIRGRRKSNLTRKTLSLERSYPIIARSLILNFNHLTKNMRARKEPLCFVFGRDTTGLTNEELKQCDYSITISTGTKYNTLNISHAAAIIFFGFQSYFRRHPPKEAMQYDPLLEGSTRSERGRVVSIFDALARASDFQDYKRQKLRETITRLLDRSNPSLRELYLLMGVANKANTKIRVLSNQASE